MLLCFFYFLQTLADHLREKAGVIMMIIILNKIADWSLPFAIIFGKYLALTSVRLRQLRFPLCCVYAVQMLTILLHTKEAVKTWISFFFFRLRDYARSTGNRGHTSLYILFAAFNASYFGMFSRIDINKTTINSFGNATWSLKL